MTNDDRNEHPPLDTGRDPQGGGPEPAPPEAGGRPASAGPPRRLLAWALALAIVAGLAAGIGTELAYGLAKQDLREGPFNPKFEGNEPPGYAQMGGYEQRDAIVEFELATKPPAEIKNAMLAYGLLGALLGSALGLAGGLARGSTRDGAAAAGLGLLAGGVAGAVASAVMGAIYFQFLTPEAGLGLPLMTHGVIWALIGMAGGLALGKGVGSRHQLPTALVGGLIGGLLGTLAFEVINALVFPQVRVFEPVPSERGPRLAAALCVAIGVALGAVLSLQERPQKKATPTKVG